MAKKDRRKYSAAEHGDEWPIRVEPAPDVDEPLSALKRP